MKEISLNTFIECYKPICNNCTPYPNNALKRAVGGVIWDVRDYTRIASNINSKTIWTIYEDDSSYYITSKVSESKAKELIGYIVCEVPYTTNDISLLKVVINKEESINLFD